MKKSKRIVWTSPYPRDIEDATLWANELTKDMKEYHTAIKEGDFWYVTNRFDPRVVK